MTVQELIDKLSMIPKDRKVVCIEATDGLSVDPREPSGYILTLTLDDEKGPEEVLALIPTDGSHQVLLNLNPSIEGSS